MIVMTIVVMKIDWTQGNGEEMVSPVTKIKCGLLLVALEASAWGRGHFGDDIGCTRQECPFASYKIQMTRI